MFLRKKQKEQIDAQISKLTADLEEIKTMLNFKIHIDYLNATGNVLATPWDEIETEPEQEKSEETVDSEFGPLYQLDKALLKFLVEECEREDGGITTFKSFISAFQDFYKQHYDEVLYTSIEVRDTMEEWQKRLKWFEISKGSYYSYKGFVLKKDKLLHTKPPVQMFLEERCEFSQDYVIKASEFNDQFHKYCQEKSLPELSASHIKQEMESLQTAYNFKRCKRSNYVYVGLKVKPNLTSEGRNQENSNA